jgi:mannose-6-phosphate isomerase-like protein (cupin superfamily)
VRGRDRLRFPEKPGAREMAYEFESLDYPAVERRLNAYYAEFKAVAADAVRLHQHPGGEFVYVLGGTLILQIGADAHVLQADDSIYFDSTVPHGYSRRGVKPCRAIVVTTG